MHSVLVSHDCRNEYQTWDFKTTHSFIVVEVGSPKSASLGQNQGFGNAIRSLEALKENQFPSYF